MKIWNEEKVQSVH